MMANHFTQLPLVEYGVQAVLRRGQATAELAQQGGYSLSGDVTAQTVGSANLSVGMVYMPPAGKSRPHVHDQHEIAILFLDGWSITASGQNLEHIAVHGPGDYKYVAAGVPHMGINLSTTEPVIGVEARSDPNFNQDVRLLPNLDEQAERVAEYVRRCVAPVTDTGFTGTAWLEGLAGHLRER